MEAEEKSDDEGFQNDLAALESNGKSLWDGQSEIHIREADHAENGKYERAKARAILSGEIEEGDTDWLFFLVEISEPE